MRDVYSTFVNGEGLAEACAIGKSMNRVTGDAGRGIVAWETEVVMPDYKGGRVSRSRFA